MTEDRDCYLYGVISGTKADGRMIPREIIDRGAVFISGDSNIPECVRYQVIRDAVFMLHDDKSRADIQGDGYACKIKKGKFLTLGFHFGIEIEAEVIYDSCERCQGERGKPGRATDIKNIASLYLFFNSGV
jgi:hypothetical protein